MSGEVTGLEKKLTSLEVVFDEGIEVNA
jgi:hypothetical protein